MNEMKIHTIADLQKYVQSYGFTNLPIRGLGRFYEHGLSVDEIEGDNNIYEREQILLSLVAAHE